MDRALYKGGIASINLEKNFGFIESIDHPEALWFSLRYVNDNLNVGDIVVYETTLNRKGQKEASRVRKVFHSANDALVIEGMNINIHPELRKQVQEEIGKIRIDLKKEYQVIEQTLKDRTGKVLCVLINNKDKIIYARPWKKKKYWKFVLDRKPESSNVLTIRLKQDQGFFIVISAHYGPSTPAFPWDQNGDFEESRIFWENHALVLDGSIRLEPDSIHGFLPPGLEATFNLQEEKDTES